MIGALEAFFLRRVTSVSIVTWKVTRVMSSSIACIDPVGIARHSATRRSAAATIEGAY